ncbi:hypothetical protein PAMA_000958 [Pampus argenteus]
MKLTMKKAALLVITENIEMESFSSEESCEVIPAREREEERSFHQRHMEHPLVSDSEDEPEPQVQIQPRPQTKPCTASPTKEGTEYRPPALSFMEEIEMEEIEMEVLPPLRVSDSELVEIKSDHPSIMTPPTASSNKACRLKWRPSPQKTGLVVKDVFCLPREHYLQLDRHIVPRGRERAALSAMGMTARITIDCGWVLLVPDTPAEGWTGEQLLRISGHGPLFVLSHQDYLQAQSEQTARATPAVDDRKEFCLEASTESCQDENSLLGKQSQPHVHRNTEEFALDLDTILRLFRQENMDRDVETQVQVRRRDLLHSALREVRRPGFCFRTTPVISFSGEEADGHEGPLREFFRLALLELQQSSVFEGQPGCLFLTYDLAALENGKYYEAGLLIGWSLAQGGPGPRCLHPALYQVVHNESLMVASMISQFTEGINSCGGLWDTVRSHWEAFVPVMTSTQQQPPTLEALQQLFTVCYSRPDSQLRAAEETTAGHWETVLTLVSDGQADFSFEELLVFITGADHLRPLGFPRLISLCFYSQDAGMSNVRLPHTSTCTLELFLPRGVTGAADLLLLLSRAVHEALGFTRLQTERTDALE